MNDEGTFFAKNKTAMQLAIEYAKNDYIQRNQLCKTAEESGIAI